MSQTLVIMPVSVVPIVPRNSSKTDFDKKETEKISCHTH